MQLDANTAVLAVYLFFVLGIGILFSRFNSNLSDYVRGGGRATWWMVGASAFMSGISAFTFTGNGSAAFDAGPTFLILYVANCCGYLLGFFFIGPWTRQSRGYTIGDIIHARYGVAPEQIYVVYGTLLHPLIAAIQLWSLAVFASAVFGFPIAPTIIVIGIIVTAYSTFGGKWAVMATDFAQGLILFSITVVVTVLSIREIGGFGEFFAGFSNPDVANDFKLIKDPGQFEGNRFTLQWIVVIFMMQISANIGMDSAHKFLAAKDGKEAGRSAMFALILMFVGSSIWFIPPMIGRFLFANEILSLPMDNPSNAAYAFVAMKVLPNGMLGLLIAAMFAATMSSMDTGLNTQTGNIVRNFIPRIRSKLNLPPLSAQSEVSLCRISTMFLGVWIIYCCLQLATQSSVRLFDAFLMFSSLVGLPIILPFIYGYWFRRIPKWGYFIISGLAGIPSLWSFIQEKFFDTPWTIQDRAMWVFIFSAIGVLICHFVFPKASQAQKDQIDTFFKLIKTPIDPEEEGHSACDTSQFTIIGYSSIAIGAATQGTHFLAENLIGHLCILFVGIFMMICGGLILWARSRELKKQTEAKSSRR